MLETKLSEAGFEPSRFDFFTGLEMPSPQKVASTPARPADPKRNDTPAPRRSRRLSTQSSDGESSDKEGRKPVRRKLLKNLESVKEEAETEEVPKAAKVAETPTRRSRRLSNQSAEGDNEDNTDKVLAIPLTLDEEDEEKVNDDENADKVCSESGSPILSPVVRRPVSINIESDSEDEKASEKMEAESEQKKETGKSAGMAEEKEQERNTDATVESEEPEKKVFLHFLLFMTEIYKNLEIGRAIRK